MIKVLENPLKKDLDPDPILALKKGSRSKIRSFNLSKQREGVVGSMSLYFLGTNLTQYPNFEGTKNKLM